MDRNALDWLFSTAPQALAALVGLIFAGVAFINGNIDKEIDLDNSQEDIYKRMKQNIHSWLKISLCLAGLSIFFDLTILICNPRESGYEFSIRGEFDIYLLIAGLVLLLNLFTLCFSLWFIIRVANPNYYEKTTMKISKQQAKNKNNVVDIQLFFEKYIALERALRKSIPNIRQYGGMRDILRELRIHGILTSVELKELNEIVSIRNLIFHGADIKYIDQKTYNNLIKYTNKIESLQDQIEYIFAR